MADLGAIGTWQDGPYRNYGLTPARVIKGFNLAVLDTYTLGGRNNSEGDPSTPSLELSAQGKWRFRAIVATGARTITINAKQPSNLSPRPSVKVKANPEIGVNADVETFAASGTGWVSVVVNITPTSDGAVWVELWNNVDGISPAYFDHLEVA